LGVLRATRTPPTVHEHHNNSRDNHADHRADNWE
jgi:hypothetical protein